MNLAKKAGAEVQSGIAKSAPVLPLGLVIKACPDILLYAQDEMRHWHQLVAAAGLVRGMMGTSPDAWQEARAQMGNEIAVITVVAIRQRISDINSPGGTFAE